MWKAATEPQCSKEIINVGGMKTFTLNEAAETVAKITGHNAIEHAEPRYEAKYSLPTYEKSVRLLDYKDEIGFEEGLRRMWEWVQKQPERKQYKWENYEITEGLYDYWK